MGNATASTPSRDVVLVPRGACPGTAGGSVGVDASPQPLAPDAASTASKSSKATSPRRRGRARDADDGQCAGPGGAARSWKRRPRTPRRCHAVAVGATRVPCPEGETPIASRRTRTEGAREGGGSESCCWHPLSRDDPNRSGVRTTHDDALPAAGAQGRVDDRHGGPGSLLGPASLPGHTEGAVHGARVAAVRAPLAQLVPAERRIHDGQAHADLPGLKWNEGSRLAGSRAGHGFAQGTSTLLHDERGCELQRGAPVWPRADDGSWRARVGARRTANAELQEPGLRHGPRGAHEPSTTPSTPTDTANPGAVEFAFSNSRGLGGGCLLRGAKLRRLLCEDLRGLHHGSPQSVEPQAKEAPPPAPRAIPIARRHESQPRRKTPHSRGASPPLPAPARPHRHCCVRLSVSSQQALPQLNQSKWHLTIQLPVSPHGASPESHPWAPSHRSVAPAQ